MKKMLIAGTNGFLARNITGYFTELGWKVSGLARREDGLHSACNFIHWDGMSLGDWTAAVDDCDVLINMVGRSVNCRHDEENKQQILQSRLHSTEVLGRAIAACGNPPELWINGSGVSIYEQSFTRPHGESGEQGEGFLADVTRKWEAELFQADIPKSVRRVALRTAMVLADEEGNPYRVLSTLAKLGLGGRAGSGKQMVSWVHIDDVPRVIEHIINHDSLTGPVNMAAPEAVTNTEMMSRFRKHVGMPIGLPAPAFGVKIGGFIMGTPPEFVLDSCYVVPSKLEESGFVFQKPEMQLSKF